MTTLADRAIAEVRRNFDDLAARIRTYDDADLVRQSGASEWTVAQVLSHLGSAAEILLATLQAARSGDEPPGRDFNQPVWDRWNALGPREQATEYVRANEQMITTLEALDDGERRDLRVPIGFLPEPIDVGTLAGMRLSESSLHGWDVRVAFDQAAALTGAEAEIAIDQLSGPLGFMLGFLGRSEKLGRDAAVVRVETTDPDRVLGLVLAPTATLGAAPAEVDGVLVGPAEALSRLLAGRLDASHTPDTVTFTSDSLTLDQIRRVFPGF